ncbi:hypothetical protein HYH03_004701 [Edaphochlamys debaryana]|uniref:NECAP PHear domain-containing protein n=1 Tax=Edaphochlamys debaryana TaxID=47281 RepID=A0A836C1T3_9CHLO|nr:hypothetical protein HYH03_004701 [Edaphochlamys debaryana]|eukprot:KAG2497110.1 hypothetical protein HYH03_004701 [Edaphochlamys debaryana]
MSRSRLAKVTLPTDAEPGTELVKWQCKEGYIYVPIPPAGTGGHRADKWDVDKWFKALKVELVAHDDDMLVRLTDQESGDLFAECPLPNDGTPLTTAVEPVVDSSRYFVLRVVDQGTRKHAFIGLGFRERSDASGFTAGLDEYRRYLLRKKEAEAMREQHERQENGEGGPPRDLTLKDNITISLKIGGPRRDNDPSAASSSAVKAAAAASSAAEGVASLKIAPPPPASAKVAPSGPAKRPGQEGGAGGSGGDEDDEWGAFTGTS